LPLFASSSLSALAGRPAQAGRRLFALILCLWLMADLAAQQRKAELPFAHLTIRDRLSHNTVYCLLQDQYGYIWAGTPHGLNRYDGYDFRLFRTPARDSDSAGFRGTTITSLLEDHAGRLWVGTAQNGLNVRLPRASQFENLKQDTAFAPIRGYHISALYEDAEGLIWIGTIEGGLLRYDPLRKRSVHYNAARSGLSNDLVFDIIQDRQGRVWVATAGVGLHLLQPDGRFALVPETVAGADNLAGYHKSLLLDGDSLWVGTEGSGLYGLDLRSMACGRIRTSPPISEGIRDLHMDSAGHIVIATAGDGLQVYQPASNQLDIYTSRRGQPHSLNTDALLCLMTDRSDNLWVGTYNGGINVHWPHQAWFEHMIPQGQPGQQPAQTRSVLSLMQSRSGTVWMGTDGGGVFQWDPQDASLPVPQFVHDPGNPASLAGNVVKSLLEDQKGRIWMGTFSEGLSRYDPATNRFTHFRHAYWQPGSLSGNNVWSMAERQNGAIWIATLGGGISVWDPRTERFRVHTTDPQIPGSLIDPNIAVVFVDQADQVWAGSLSRGLERWDPDRQIFIHHQHDPADSLSLSDDAVRVIFQDRRGDLWIGTEGGGLNRWLGGGQFERIGTREGLLDLNVMGISEDQEGWLWLSTYEGLTRFHPETRTFQSFDFRSEVNTNQFNQLALITLRDGRIMGGGIEGVHTISPHRLAKAPPAPRVFLTDLQVFNQRIEPGPSLNDNVYLKKRIEVADTIFLDHADQAFTLFFASTRYDARSQFSYRMRGFNDDWQLGSPGQNRATYTDLPPGSYHFEVSLDGEIAAVMLRISPPFWETFWFRVLMTLLGLSIIGLSMAIMVRRREQQHEQELLVANAKILALENEQLNNTLKTQNAKLMSSSAQAAQKNELISALKDQLQSLPVGAPDRLKSILDTMDRELKGEKYWEEFDFYMHHVDKAFTQAILARHPDLTQNDLRICLLIRLNLTTKETAALLNITPRGVEQSRYRLKKRLNLPREADLRQYIHGFDQPTDGS